MNIPRNKEYDQPCKLMTETVRLVKENGIENAARKTSVPFGWLQKFCSGTFQNPSVNRVVHIYTVLSGNKLI